MRRTSRLLLLSVFFLVGACTTPVSIDNLGDPKNSDIEIPKEGETADKDVDKQIISAQWMTSDFTQELESAFSGQKVGLLVKTRNYAPGETLLIVISSSIDSEGGVTMTIKGKVGANGETRMIMPVH